MRIVELRVVPSETILHHLKIYVGTDRNHRPNRSKDAPIFVLLRPFNLYILAGNERSEMFASGIAERWACPCSFKLKPFSAWVSYFPSKGLKIPLGRSQNSPWQVSKSPSKGKGQ